MYQVRLETIQTERWPRPPSRERRLVVLLRRLDPYLVVATLATSVLGVLAVYAATRDELEIAGISPTYDAVHQAIFVLVGVLGMAATMAVDYRRLGSLAGAAYGAALLALLAVLSPLGHSALGSARWIEIGPVQLQPSEFAVLALVLSTATLAARWQDGITTRRLVVLLGAAGLPILLVERQPDLGTAIVLGVIVVAMVAVAGATGRQLLGLALLAVASAVAAIHLGLLHSYQLHRLTSFAHPTASNPATYNMTQSEVAIGSGGLLGHGLLRPGIAAFGYVPSQTTDFIFSVVGEQFGFLGAASLLGLFGVILWRVLRVARTTRDPFGRLLCAGVLAFLAFSVVENVGMAVGIMPVAGIPLPFVSYGGSAILVDFVSVGVVLSVAMRAIR